MPTLEVTVPLTPAYNAAYQQLVVINETVIKLSIDVQEGRHTFTSPYQEVGTLKYFKVPRLEAAIRVSYYYQGDSGTIELFGNDYVSPGPATCLFTRPVGTDQVCLQHTYPGDTSPCGSNPNWNYSLQYTPGLPAALTASIRKANDAIIAAAKTVFPIVRVNTPPPILRSVEETHKWMIMRAKDGTNLGVFDPAKEYPEGTTMENHLHSTWGGRVTFKQDENIANVIGSSTDPRIKSLPWIQLWEEEYGLEDQCTSHNWSSTGPFACNDSDQKNRIGGHVVSGKVAKVMPKGSDQVYIIPICKAHNNDNRGYMRAHVYLGGIWLKNYLK